MCGTGWNSASWGKIEIEYLGDTDYNKDEDPDLFISSIPMIQPAIIPNILQYYPTKHNDRRIFEIPYEFSCKYFNISIDGGDEYYPRGNYEINNFFSIDELPYEDW
jgi:hypothetical protein